MKRFTLMLALALFVTTAAFAQLTGTKNVPGDYPTLTAAIAALNSQGVGEGGVVINVIAENTVTAPAEGFTITTRSATEANPVVIEGNGNRIIGQNQRAANVPVNSIFKINVGENVSVTGFVTKEEAQLTFPMERVNR